MDSKVFMLCVVVSKFRCLGLLKLAGFLHRGIKGKGILTLTADPLHANVDPLVFQAPGLVEVHDPTLPIKYYSEFPIRNPRRKGSEYLYDIGKFLSALGRKENQFE